MNKEQGLEKEIQSIVETAYSISEDIGEEVEAILHQGLEEPLSYDEVESILDRVVQRLRKSETLKGIPGALDKLEGDITSIIDDIIMSRTSTNRDKMQNIVKLQEYNGTKPSPVKPTQIFHARSVQMKSGYVDTLDINLWSENDRLEIHTNQFMSENGRQPQPDELLDIMLSRMPLKGISKKDQKDQFDISNLARSIAINGVRKPPIIDLNGDLLDGNRRVAACYYILHSDDFTPSQKKIASKIFVWQLTEHATDDDRRAVVVSLNFESDNKLPWPEYVKANRVYEDWQEILSIEPRPSTERSRELRRELSEIYALGPNTVAVDRYLRMVDWANEFKEHHESRREKEKYEVEHRTSKHFQYFDELSKGKNPGGVAHTLNEDEAFKHLVYDLLYDDKFKNWTLIRRLKFYDDTLKEELEKARQEDNNEFARNDVEAALDEANSRRRESRVVGANPRIRTFVKWLEDLPISAFRDEITEENLELLLQALSLVETQIAEQKKSKSTN